MVARMLNVNSSFSSDFNAVYQGLNGQNAQAGKESDFNFFVILNIYASNAMFNYPNYEHDYEINIFINLFYKSSKSYTFKATNFLEQS